MTRPRSDRGSIIPLILGFFLLTWWLAGGGIALANASMRQADLQAFCDGTAAAVAASAGDSDAVLGGNNGGLGSLTLSETLADQAATDYRAIDRSHDDVQFSNLGVAGRTEVTLDCTRRVHFFAEALYAHPTGMVLHVTSTADAPLK